MPTPKLTEQTEQAAAAVAAPNTFHDPRRPSGNVQPLLMQTVEVAPVAAQRWPGVHSVSNLSPVANLLNRKKSRHRMSGGILRYSSSYDPHQDLSHRVARKRLQKRGVHFTEDIVKEFDMSDLVILPEQSSGRVVPKRAQIISLARAASMSSHRGSPPPSDMNLLDDIAAETPIVVEYNLDGGELQVENGPRCDSCDMLGDLVDEIVADEQEGSPADSSQSFKSEASSCHDKLHSPSANREPSTDSFDPDAIETYTGLLSAPSVDFNAVKLVPYFTTEEKLERKREARQLFRFLLAVAWLRQGQGCTLRAATTQQRNTLAASLDNSQIQSGIPGSVFVLSGSGYPSGAKGRRLCAEVKQRLSADMQLDGDQQDSDGDGEEFEYFGDAALDIWPHSVICFGSQMVTELPLGIEDEALLQFPADSGIISRSSSRLRTKSLPNSILRGDSNRQSRRIAQIRAHKAQTAYAKHRGSTPMQGLLAVRLGDIRSIRVDRRVKAGAKLGSAPLVYNYSTMRVRHLARPLVLQWSQMKDAHMFANSIKLLLACLCGETETFTEVGGVTSRIRCRHLPHSVQEIVDVHFASSHNRSVLAQEQSWRARQPPKAPKRPPRNSHDTPSANSSQESSPCSSNSSSNSAAEVDQAVAVNDSARKGQVLNRGKYTLAPEESILSTNSSTSTLCAPYAVHEATPPSSIAGEHSDQQPTPSSATDSSTPTTHEAQPVDSNPPIRRFPASIAVPPEVATARIDQPLCELSTTPQGLPHVTPPIESTVDLIPKRLQNSKKSAGVVARVQPSSGSHTPALEGESRNIPPALQGGALTDSGCAHIPAEYTIPSQSTASTTDGETMLVEQSGVFLDEKPASPILEVPAKGPNDEGSLSTAILAGCNAPDALSTAETIAASSKPSTVATREAANRSSSTPSSTSDGNGSMDSMSLLQSDSDDFVVYSPGSSKDNGGGSIASSSTAPSRDLVLISNPFLLPIAKDSIYSRKTQSIVRADAIVDVASQDSGEHSPPRSKAMGAATEATHRTAQLHAAYNAMQGDVTSVRGRVQRAQAVRIALEQDRTAKATGASALREYKLMQAAFRRSNQRAKLPTHAEHEPDMSASSKRTALRAAQAEGFGGLDSSFGQPRPLPGRKRQYTRSASGTIQAVTPFKVRSGQKPVLAQSKGMHAAAAAQTATAKRVRELAARVQRPVRAPWMHTTGSDESASLASHSMAYSESQSAATPGNWWHMIAGKPGKLLTSMPY